MHLEPWFRNAGRCIEGDGQKLTAKNSRVDPYFSARASPQSVMTIAKTDLALLVSTLSLFQAFGLGLIGVVVLAAFLLGAFTR